uniref:Uncharacterized protein n=1 Tax=Rhizophagus irregularis (strain DAOM 181602 / DAOM 197198 / MUCL 43194) TaxID=747089 RepID=U9UIX8_RHIID
MNESFIHLQAKHIPRTSGVLMVIDKNILIPIKDENQSNGSISSLIELEGSRKLREILCFLDLRDGDGKVTVPQARVLLVIDKLGVPEDELLLLRDFSMAFFQKKTIIALGEFRLSLVCDPLRIIVDK